MNKISEENLKEYFIRTRITYLCLLLWSVVTYIFHESIHYGVMTWVVAVALFFIFIIPSIAAYVFDERTSCESFIKLNKELNKNPANIISLMSHMLIVGNLSYGARPEAGLVYLAAMVTYFACSIGVNTRYKGKV